MEHILAAEGVTKKFVGHVALDNISLSIPKNCIYGLLGPNGAGKTTFIRIINQITHPDSGSILFDGRKLEPEDVAQIGYLPEERGLYKSMKVGEQAMYLAQLKGLSKAEAKSRLKMWFEKLEIGDWWNKKIQELSKGMAQKIQFIVTVLHEPKLLIFDEPFSGFDPINANRIKEEIQELKDKGTSIIFSTHRMESVEELCDHIALLNNAKKVLDGKLKDIKKAYKNNIYNISVQLNGNANDVLKEITSNYNVKTSEYSTAEHLMDLQIQLPNNDTRSILSTLSSKGNIVHFEETVPSVSDIFIKAVGEAS
ncbi:ABC transporter ATP-binding protein [Croceivirga thetidis]|uniref:ABC transporter ATP-binding protein n=1 Tax=Croceivirga thetidis TaxID=2721623 RepID=A0ABX1GSR0_9FLAO|nr:ATP-binding cassette domain-containing protein [Croceivirga thetidis]NKI32987.1 ABC transporter ATP-binding protein [Croceivirga thetidis]